MAYITNDGARLIERARTEGISIVFGSVRMNTIYKSDPTSLVQQTEEWFGENHGSVVGCLSHVSVDDVSQVCDSKLAVQCNDNSVSWKSLGIYAHLDGEVDELLFACESIENGEYKDVTIVELPVTLDGVVDDFGISEGGSGGGGEVPANMMTTDTVQTDLTGIKRWEHKTYYGGASAESPNEGDSLNVSIAEIGRLEGASSPLLCSNSKQYYNGSKWLEGRASYAQLTPRGVLELSAGSTFDGHYFVNEPSVEISPSGVNYTPRDTETLSASWDNIINAANSGAAAAAICARQDKVQDDGQGNLMIFGQTITPNSDLVVDSLLFTFDSSGYLKSVCRDWGAKVATIGVIVHDVGGNMVENGSVSGFSMNARTPLTFQSPIQLAAGYTITYQAIISLISIQ